MKKNLLTLALISVMTLGAAAVTLASCNKEKKEETDTTQFYGDGTNLITMQAANGEFEHIRNMVDAYNTAARKLTPDTDYTIKLKVIDLNEGEVGNRFNTDPASVPVFMHTPGNNTNKWSLSNKLVGFEGDLFGPDAVSAVNGQTPNVSDDGWVAKDGQYTAAAFTNNTYFLVYDKRVYKNPSDVADVISMQKAFKAYNEQNKDNKDLNYDYMIATDFGNGWQLQSILYRNDVTPLQGEDGTDGDMTAFRNQKEKITGNFIDLAKYMQERQDNGSGLELPLFNAYNQASILDPKADNGASAFITGTWDITNIQEAIGAENVGTAVLPKLLDTKSYEAAKKNNSDVKEEDYLTEWPMLKDYKYVTLNLASYNELNDAQKNAAREFLLYSVTKDGQEARFTGKSVTPAVYKEEPTSELWTNYVARETLVKSLSGEIKTFIQPSTQGWNSWWTAGVTSYNAISAVSGEGKKLDFNDTKDHYSGDYWTVATGVIQTLIDNIAKENGIS